ncbi:TaqI-like C-terminal specificity domain-containing protein [Deinococcus sp. PEB2-67]
MWGIGNKIYWGIKTGCNEAFVINGEKRAQLIAADPRSAEIIQPLAVGDDVRRWHVRDKGRYLIFARRGIDISKYPAIRKHLEHYQEQLEPRPRNWPSGKSWSGRKPGSYKWYEIQDDVAYFREFDKPKIIYPEISKDSRFTFDETGLFVNNKAFIVQTDDLYLLGVLSSRIVWKYLEGICSIVQGHSLELRSIHMATVPIPVASNIDKDAIATLVKACLDRQGERCQALENQIEAYVQALYGLTPQSIS